MKIFFSIFVIFALGFLAFMINNSESPKNAQELPTYEEKNVEQPRKKDKVNIIKEQQLEKVIEINASQWTFEPSVIKVKKDTEVKLILTSSDVEHGLAIPEYNINEIIKPGTAIEVKFKANKIGEFDFYCSVLCGDNHYDMGGKLIVE